MRATLILILVSLIGSLCAEEIAGRSFPGGTSFRIHAPIGVLPSGGFFPVRVEIQNKTKKTLSWKINCTSEMSSHGHYSFSRSGSTEGEVRSQFLLSCPPGEQRVIDLLIPINQILEGQSASRMIRFDCVDANMEYSVSRSFSEEMGRYKIGLSDKILQRFEADLVKGFSRKALSASSGYSSSSSKPCGGVDVSRLPEDWRAYSGYDTLALSRLDFQSVSPGARVALDQWVRSGGHLILLNDGAGPVPAFEKLKENDGLGLRSRLDFGFDFGAFQGAELAETITRGGESFATRAELDYGRGSWQMGRALGSRSLSKAFLFIVLLVFAIVVGPVNLFLWANKNRRHRLFVTTPIISLGASLFLVGYIIIRDGFGGDGVRAIAIEVGGPDDKSAVILQEQFSRSGILFSPSFDLDSDSILVPVVAPESDLNREDSASSMGTHKLDYSQTKEGWDISGDLFESRSEQAQILRSVQPSRERLELVSGSAGTPRLASSFSYELTDVFYQDENDKVWTAAAIAPGETVTLSPSSTDADGDIGISKALARFGSSNRRQLKRLLNRNNSFVALASEAPAVATHTSIDWEDSPTLITGLLSQ